MAIVTAEIKEVQQRLLNAEVSGLEPPPSHVIIDSLFLVPIRNRMQSLFWK